MRSISLILLLAACTDGGDPLAQAPTDCQPGHLTYSSTVGGGGLDEGDFTISSYAFVNALNGENGSLDLGDIGGGQGTDRVYVEFPKLVPNGGSVQARGLVKLVTSGIAGGNCETGSFSGKLAIAKSGGIYRFGLEGLHTDPYCSGAALSGSFGGCYNTGN